MKLSLERLDTRGLVLEIPGADRQTLTIASTENLQGTIAIEEETTTLSGVQADAIVLSSLRLLLGRLVLSGASGATLTGLGVTLERSTESLGLDTKASSLAASELDIDIDDVAIRGRVHFEDVKLTVNGEAGTLAAESVAIEAFSLRLGDVALHADVIRGAAVAIAWGTTFGLSADSLAAPSIQMQTPAARVGANDVELSTFRLDGGKVTARRASARGARVEAKLASSESSNAAGRPATAVPQATPVPVATSTSRESLFDSSVLDALHGQLDVDVELDLTVPIIGRRRATHRLRVAIDQGTIDYRALERNLSALEDAILDFAVRDDSVLALERVNPLFPARGHGKPIIAWPLAPPDLELAKRDRVRLSLLPLAQVVGSDEPSDPSAEPKKSAVALRHLGLVNLAARLALAPTTTLAGHIRPKHVGSFALGGNVYYDPGEATPPGLVRGEVEALAVSVHSLAIGGSTLNASVEVAKMPAFEVAFADVTPTTIQIELAELVIADLAVLPTE